MRSCPIEIGHRRRTSARYTVATVERSETRSSDAAWCAASDHRWRPVRGTDAGGGRVGRSAASHAASSGVGGTPALDTCSAHTGRAAAARPWMPYRRSTAAIWCRRTSWSASSTANVARAPYRYAASWSSSAACSCEPGTTSGVRPRATLRARYCRRRRSACAASRCDARFTARARVVICVPNPSSSCAASTRKSRWTCPAAHTSCAATSRKRALPHTAHRRRACMTETRPSATPPSRGKLGRAA